MSEDHRNEFEKAVQADMLVNTMIRIARDLERLLTGMFAAAGLLGLIAFLLVFRLLIGR